MADDKRDNAPVEADIKYGQLDEKLVMQLRQYEFDYFREDKPIPFCGLQIHPATVRHYEDFAGCCSCLTLNKNEDPKGISISHLDYLLQKTQIQENGEGRHWSYKLQRLCEIIFHIQNGLKCKKCGSIIKYTDQQFIDFVNKINNLTQNTEQTQENIEVPKLECESCGCDEFIEMIKIIQDPVTKKYSLMIDSHTITSKDYTKLRQIVLYQNYPDYVDDSWVDPDIKKDHDEKMRLQQQNNDLHATIEKKVVCLSIATHYKIDEIYNMSIRRFTMALSTVDDLINYQIMKQATMSGFVSLPKGKSVEHWIYKPDKDMYGDSYKSTEDIQNSVSNL